MDDILAKIEALIFVTGDEGLSIRELCKVVKLTQKQVILKIEEINKKLINNPHRGIIIKTFGNYVKFVTKKKLHPFLATFARTNKVIKLKQPALECLAIIAYNSPTTRVEVDSIRGVDSSFMLSKLVNLNLIEEAGRANSPGMPILYKVTPLFMDTFNLKSLSNLPKIKDLKKENDPIHNLFESNKI